MRIDAYEFGSISVGGQSYHTDVIITPHAVFDGWLRREGHCLYPEDLYPALAAQPEIMVIGTGYYGNMRVPESTRQQLTQQGVNVIDLDTKQAVHEFNILQRDCARIVAALHLTC